MVVKHGIKKTALFLGLALIVACGSGHAKNIADALANALDFENGTTKSTSDLPSHQTDLTTYGQVTKITLSTPSLHLRESFLLTLTGTPGTQPIKGAIVHPQKASVYIEIIKPFDSASQTMVLRGRLLENEALLGRDFSLDVAFLHEDGKLGPAATWSLPISQDEEIPTAQFCEGWCSYSSSCQEVQNPWSADVACTDGCAADDATWKTEAGEICYASRAAFKSCLVTLSCPEEYSAWQDFLSQKVSGGTSTYTGPCKEDTGTYLSDCSSYLFKTNRAFMP